MSIVLAPIGVGFQFFGGNTVASQANQPLSGGLLNVYAAGTTTPVTTYTSSSGSVANTNPIVLDSAGRVPFEIWWTAGSSYKFVLQDSLGNAIPNGTWDNVPGINDYTQSANILATYVSYTPPGTGAVATTIAALENHRIVPVTAYGAKIDGSTDDTAAIQACWNAAQTQGFIAYHPPGTSICASNLTIPSGICILGAGTFGTPLAGWTAPSIIKFTANNGGCIVSDAYFNSTIIEKLSFLGDYLSYTNQIGIYLNDSVRTSQIPCGLVLRDVMFKWFSVGLFCGTKYQTIFGFNVAAISCSNVGFQIQSSDCYFHMLTAGNSSEGSHTNYAATAQLYVGVSSPSAVACGNNQFLGLACFSGARAVIVSNSQYNKFIAGDFQLAQNESLLIGDGSHQTVGNVFVGIEFSENNLAGGLNNVNNLYNCDVTLQQYTGSTKFVGCDFCGYGGGYKTAGAINFYGGTFGNIIEGNVIHTDNIANPGGTGQPYPFILQTGATLDSNIIGRNTVASETGGTGSLLDAQRVQPQYIANGTINLTPGVAVINNATAINLTLPNPGWSGRQFRVILFTGNNSTVVASTSNGFDGAHTTATFTASEAFIDLVSEDATHWNTLNSRNVTFT